MRKLEIGCNNQRLSEEWETLDIVSGKNADIVVDIEKPLPIESNTYDLIYMSHVLEHITWYKTIDVLKELLRILKSGGTIEIFVPDIDKIISAYQKGIIPDEWYKYNEQKNPFLWFAGRLFTYGAHDTDFHRAVFNKKHLQNCLEKAGFQDVMIIKVPRGISHGYINLGMKGTKKCV
jgi:predicted SAM-dependent methyltransferase